ncbi:hypothetical protein Nepgr_016061 [Nepenthes gracilis]|uniref:LsmAD domain-containing protein n=1 Tax=Nepenthes gracilis TaxID=150966 RepID=A0AAD3XS66_NEPGR|nr:hypothetical protein Nepgr_016061 [Nepenthes gracilis]
METSKTVAHEIGGIQNDALRFGLHGVKSDIVEAHPLQSAYQSAKKTQDEMKRKVLASTYGMALPLKMDLDKQIISRFQRPPGAIPSSMLGLDALTGSLDDITFEDYLIDPHDSEAFLKPDMHHGMEGFRLPIFLKSFSRSFRRSTLSKREVRIKMEASKAVVHEIGGIQNDALRFGLHGVKSDIVEAHPLQSAYQSAKKTEDEMKRKVLASMYGTALPLKMDLDRQILSRFQRPPGAIPSSMLGLDALTGSLDDITFEDYLIDPHDSEAFQKPDMHHGMEVRLGLSKGPGFRLPIFLKLGLRLLHRMSLQQAVQPRSSANGFSRRRVEKGVTSGSKTRDRLVYLTTCLIGHQVDVQVKNGSVFSGIFHATNADKDFGIVLKMARLTKDASSRGQKAVLDTVGKAPSKTLIIPAHEFVQVIAKGTPVTRSGLSNELQVEKQQEIMLDSCISQSRHVEVERELERWVPDKDDPQCSELDNIFDRPWTGSWDQFKVNEALFGVKSTFNEELYTTKLEKGPQTRELEEEAIRIAREIVGEETHDLHLAEERGTYPHGNFEMDEETRFSSVFRGVDDSGCDEDEDVMCDSRNTETFGNSSGPTSSRSFADMTSGKCYNDEVQPSQLNANREFYQSGSLAPELRSRGNNAVEDDVRVHDNHISEEREDALVQVLVKMQTCGDEAQTTISEDSQSSITKKDGPDRITLSPDTTAYAASNVLAKGQEKTSSLHELSDDSISGKVHGAMQSKNSRGQLGSSTSSTSESGGATSASSGPALSPSSSMGSLSSEKSSLNPNAKEFKLNPNAKSFVPSQTPIRPLSPANDGSFYFPTNLPALPHMPGMPVGFGIGPSFAGPQPLLFNPQAVPVQTPQAYISSNGTQYGQPMIMGHPRQVIYMPGYPMEMPYKGREY